MKGNFCFHVQSQTSLIVIIGRTQGEKGARKEKEMQRSAAAKQRAQCGTHLEEERPNKGQAEPRRRSQRTEEERGDKEEEEEEKEKRERESSFVCSPFGV
jgi:hypothetical protein